MPTLEKDKAGGLRLDAYISLEQQKKAELLSLSKEEKTQVATIIATSMGGFTRLLRQ